MAPSTAKKMIATSFGRIAYLEAGAPTSPPVLFVHGIPTSSYLWRKVLPFLEGEFHCYAPDLMGLGDSEVDPSAVELHMENQAEMLIEFMANLGHHRFGLVCHDQGGAAAQIIAARYPERISCMVMTNCVCYDNWPVPAVRILQRFVRTPLLPSISHLTGLGNWLQKNERTSAFKRGVFNKSALTDETIDEYLRPLNSKAGQQRFKAFTLAGDPRFTQDVVPELRRFDRPTLILWAADDYYLSPSWAVRLSRDIPGVRRLELVPFCGHFWPEEKPAEFAAPMAAFLAQHLSASSEARAGA